MLIRMPAPWNRSDREVTPESVWLNRRDLLTAAGFLGMERLLSAATYPAKQNPKFASAGRAITEEWAATGYNNFYEFDPVNKQAVKDKIDKFVVSPWKVEVGGLVAKPQSFDLDEIVRTMPLEERVYRFRCVEAWAMTVPWTGFPFSELVKRVEPKAEAKYVRFVSALKREQMPGLDHPANSRYTWPYYEALRMDEAMNPLTLMATGLYGKPLPKQNGAPIRIVTPWKYGYKSIKSIVKIEFTSRKPPTFWNDAQPTEYGFFSNVNPKKPHPRWSQATEKVIPTMTRVETLPYNSYGEYVEAMYKGDEF
jgi:sulfoxide reductase catalytic subunit YedY